MIVFTDKVCTILRDARRFKFLKRAQVQRRHFPHDRDGSATRTVLRKMGTPQEELIKCIRPPENTSAPIIYVPTELGCNLLAEHTGEMELLLDCEPNTRVWQNFAHNLQVTDLFMTVDDALARQDYVRMPKLHFEHDLIPAADGKKKLRLYTQVSEKVACVPDAASLEVVQVCSQEGTETFYRTTYWELETGSDSPGRAAARKAPGYYGLHQSKKFRLHFPESWHMQVVAVCPHPGWRDAMKKAMKDKPGAELWRFVYVGDITPESFLHAPIFYTTTSDEPRAFVKPPQPAPGADPPACAPPVEAQVEEKVT